MNLKVLMVAAILASALAFYHIIQEFNAKAVPVDDQLSIACRKYMSTGSTDPFIEAVCGSGYGY